MRYNHLQRILSVLLVSVMLILALPAEVIANGIEALEQKDPNAVQSQQKPTDSTDEGQVPEGELFYLDNGLVLELNEDGNSFAVIDFMNVKATSVQIPDTYLGMEINRIGDLAFKGKTALTEVILSDNIKHIGDDVFSGCANLQCLEENGGKYIRSATNAHFYLLSASNQDITDCTVSNETKIIASYAFHNCKNLTEITIPDSVIQVGFRALRGCDNLESVVLPFVGETENGSVNSHVGFVFGARTYGGNISFVPEGLKQLIIKRGTLQKNALYGLDGVEHLGLPGMQYPLGYYYGGDSFEDNIDYIPAALIRVDVAGGPLPEKAFYNCVNLENILLGDAVTDIGPASEVFYKTKFLTQQTMWVDDVLYSGNHLLAAKSLVSGEYNIREGTLTISPEAFYECDGLTAVTIPDTLTDIGRNAFAYCSGLSNVHFGSGVVNIGAYAFRSTSVTEAVLPDTVKRIDNGAFYSCKNLTNIAIQDGVSYIGDNILEGCSSLVELQIPYIGATLDATENTFLGYFFGGYEARFNSDEVPASLRVVAVTGGTFIDENAFYQCSGITTVKIPGSVERIGSYAFSGCSGITDVYTPSIIAWSRIDFANRYSNPLCHGGTLHVDNEVTTELVIPEGTTVIEGSAYRYWKDLEIVVIPDGVTRIGSSAFEGCTGLISVVIPNSVTSIDASAFKDCSALTSITIGEGVTKIDYSAFYNCTALEEIRFNAVAMEDLKQANSVFYNAGVNGDGITVTVGAKVTKIPALLFNPYHSTTYAPKIISLVFENNSVCECIGSYAFENCTALTTITVPENIVFIGNGAFGGCAGLENIYFNAIAVENLADDNYVFHKAGQSGNGLRVTFGSNVNKIPDYLFSPNANPSYKPNVTEVVFTEGSACQSIGKYAFSKCTSLTAVYITDIASWCRISFHDRESNPLCFARILYCNDERVTELNVPHGITGIGAWTFANCSSITSVVIPDSVISIDSFAFQNCSGITAVEIPNSVISIGSYAFDGCSSLTALTIGENVNNIGNNAFSDCTALEDIHFNASIVADFTSGNYVFLNAGKKSSGIAVIIGENVTRIPAHLFHPGSNGPNIASVVFEEESVCTSIGAYAFSGSNMTSIAIPASIKSVDEYAFYALNSLTAVHITDISAWSQINFAALNANPLYYAKKLYLNGELVTQVKLTEGIAKIGDYVFYNCTGLTSVTIPASVTEIGTDVFYGCNGLTQVHINDLDAWCKINFATSASNPLYSAKNLLLNGETVTEVVIPEGVTEIGANLFYGCTSITKVTIPSTVTTIGASAFYGCSGLTEVQITDLAAWCEINFAGSLSNPLYYANNLLLNGDAVTEVVFLEGTTEIGSNIFIGCTSITKVTIPSTVTRIGANAFYGCSGITTVEFGQNITSIGGYAFYGCSGLTSIEIGEKVTTIGARAFYGCSQLTSITIPAGVTKIEDYTFYGCAAVTGIIIPDGVTQIGTSAFSNCTKLRKVTIPASVTSIGNNAFYSCSALTGVYISDLAAWCNISFTSGGSNPLYYAKKLYLNNTLVTQVQFPEETSAIGNYLFYNCTSLTSVTIPESVTSIGNYAFYGCSGLTGITIAEGVTSIGNYAFSGCNQLTGITIPNSVTSIGQYAFQNCSKAEQLIIGEELTTIGTSAFSGCYILTEIHFNATAISSMNTNTKAFTYAGKNAGGITVTIGANVTSIPVGLFYASSSSYTNKIVSVVFEEESVCTSIGNYAFGYCNKLKTIEIPASVTSIGNYAFQNCSVLARIEYEGSYAQWKNVKLGSSWNQNTGSYSIYCSDATVTKDGAVSYLSGTSSGASARCGYQAGSSSDSVKTYSSGLTYVSNGNGTCYVSGRGACKDTDIVIPSVSPSGETIVGIGESAFHWDLTLTSITIPETITSIGKYAFYTCNNLERVYFNATAMEDLADDVQPFFSINSSEVEIAVYIGANVTRIPAYLFAGNAGVVSVVFEEGSVCREIGDAAFRFNGKITNLTLPDSMTSIGNGAFFSSGLTEIVIPDGVTYLGGSAFGSTPITKIEIPDMITHIGMNPFQYTPYAENTENWTGKALYIGNYLLEVDESFNGDFVIREGTVAVAASAFRDCDLVRSVVIPEGVTVIADNTFMSCDRLQSVTIPEGVTLIGRNAFNYCPALTSIHIPGSVEIIDDLAFYQCAKLAYVTFGEGSMLRSIGSRAFAQTAIGDDDDAVFYPADSLAWRFVQKSTDWDGGLTTWPNSFAFGEDVTLLYEMSDDRMEFYVGEYNGIGETVQVPDLFSGRTVTQIYSKAFYNAIGLKSVVIPDSVNYICQNVFYNCPDLSEIVISDEDVILERGVIYGCDALHTMTVPFLGRTVTDRDNGYIGYLFGATSYKSADSYVPMSLKAVTLSDAEFIGDHAFHGCTYLASINLPDRVTSVGNYAFYGCEGLTGEWSLPTSLTAIGDFAFASCNSLSRIVMPEGLTQIGEYAFSDCILLQELSIPDSVTSIGVMLLDNCSNVKTIEIGSGLREIPDVAAGNPLFGINKSVSSLTGYIVSQDNDKFIADDRGVLLELHNSLNVPVAVLDAPAKSDLKDYQLSEHIVYIAPYAFAYNTTLRWIQLDRVRRIDKCAFMEATSLIAAVFGSETGIDGETEQYAKQYDAYIAEKHREGEVYSQFIGDQAFFGCTMLQYVNLWTDFIVSIGQEAFYDCTKLTSVHLSGSIRNIGHNAFAKTSLEGITVAEDNARYADFDNVLYEKLDDGTYKLLLYPACKTGVQTDAVGKVYQTSFALPEDVAVSMIESYAFRDTQYVKHVSLDPSVEMLVGDYAFQDASVQTVFVGKKITSLGLVRGEGEYTVFDSCESLTAIEVAKENLHYSSQDGVLFDKEQTKLIKYPYHKAGREYSLPDTVSVIASMAFKGNKNLTNIVVSSYVHTVGLEAFYDCSNLVSIYFDHVHAPMSVLENAFTTNTVAGAATQAVLCYSGGYYDNGSKGEYGWKNYQGIYPLYESNVIPSFDPLENTDLFYAVVVVDSSGVPVDGAVVSMTDPHDKTEVITAADGIAMFYDNGIDTENYGFTLSFDDAYSVTVTDPSGNYFAFTNPSLMLDGDMLITYITLTRLPTAYGVSCNGQDINSQRLELNKSNIDFTDVLLDENGNIQYAADGKTPMFEEAVDISVIGYCDTGFAFDEDACGLYQNGVKVASVVRTEDKDGANIFTFRPYVADLANEVDLEVRLTAVSESGQVLSCNTVLNIHVFDFFVDPSQLQLDDANANIDLGAAGEFVEGLLGGDGLSLSFGEHIKFNTTLEDDTVTFKLEGSKELNEKKKSLINDYKKGFEENNKRGMDTYRFQYTALFKDVNFKISTLRYNITFTRETESSGFYYYRCNVHNGAYGLNATDSNLIASFYGVVNKLDVAGMDTRDAAKLKADLIFAMHYGYVLTEGADEDTIKAGTTKARYSEVVVQLPDKNMMVTKQKLEVSVSGEISLQHIGNGDFRCTGGAIKGSVVYQFNHDQQLMIWVIPVTLRVEAKGTGELALSIEVDEQQQVDWEFLFTLDIDITASIGVGCSAASVGFYGNVGTVFVLEILPEFTVQSWKIYGEMGAYARVLWFEHRYRFTPDSWADGHYIVAPKEDAAETIMLSEMTYAASMYLADSYAGANVQSLQDAYQPVVIDGELYKICYADVTGKDNYDAYNYVKLALSKWDGQQWSEPVIIDDNGLNDAEYTLYQQDGKLMMTYTQQTQRLTASTANDTYSAAKNLQIKVVELSENLGKPVSVAQRNSYAYLTQYAIIDGVPTLVWAENANNNMFGVSPDNYIDSTGKSHVFATDANSVWMSRFMGGTWTAPECLEKGLSAITQIAINDSGSLGFIVDTNGDLTDTADRQLYYGNVNGEVTMFNDLTAGSVKSIIADGDRFLYYYDGVAEDQISGWLSMSDMDTFPKDAPEDFAVIYDGDGDVFGIAYSKNKTWQDTDGKCTGSAIYGRYLEDGIWGEEVEISAYIAENDRYVQNFTAVLVGQELLVSASTVNGAGENLLHSTGTCKLGARLTAQVNDVDYSAGQVTFAIQNIGTAASPVYMSVDNGAYALICESLPSGSIVYHTASLPTDVKSVHFGMSPDGLGTVSAGDVCLTYSDFRTDAKQLLLGANDFLLFSVRNLGNTTNSGITVIRNGAFDAATMAGGAAHKAVMALNLKAGELTPFTFVNENGEIETAWAVLDLIKPNGIAYHELVLSENSLNPLLSIYTIPMTALEPDSMLVNNYACLNYSACDGVLQNGQISSANPVLGCDFMEFDTDEEKLVIRFFCSEEDSIQQVRIGNAVLSAEDYAVVKRHVGGEIHISSDILSDLKGSCTVTVTFKSGEEAQMQLKIMGHYTVTWIDADKILHQENLAEGAIPSFHGEMLKEPDEAWCYSFAGWDYNGDAVADSLGAITENVTLTAVWNAVPRTYTVMWSMKNSTGREVVVPENYFYGDHPNYLGTIFTPEGMQFAGWNATLEPVTGDVVYAAVYETAKPVMVGLEIEKLPEKLTYHQGQTIDLTGLIVYKCMSDGSKKAISHNLLRISADMWSIGMVDVTISYAGFKAYYQIAVEKTDIQLSADNAIASPGQTVTIGVHIDNNPGITSLQYQIMYDEAMMELIHVENTGLLGGYQEPAPGIYTPYTLIWTQAGAGEGTMVFLTFLILDDVSCGTYGIDIEAVSAQLSNGQEEQIPGTVANITVPPTITLAYPTLSLEDEIKMNVYFSLDQNIDLSKMGMLTWTSKPDKVDISTADAVIPGGDFSKEDGLYFVSTNGIPAQYLGDTVYFCIYVELADGSICYGRQVSYSPATYAYSQLGKPSTSETAKSLYVALLNYGAAAQKYLNYKIDALINNELTAEQQAMADEFRADMVHGVINPDAVKAGEFVRSKPGFPGRQPNISLDAAFAINYYFTPGYEVVDDMMFYYWNAEDFDAVDVLNKENATGSMFMTEENGVYGATISGIAAKDIDSALYACGVYTDASGNTYCTGVLPYSLGYYCGNQAKGEGALAELAASIAVYGYYAAAYFT